MSVRKLKKKIALVMLGILVLSIQSYAGPGTTWLEIGMGGRAAALGEAGSASSLGPSATYWNPALVGMQNGVEVMNASWALGTVSQFVSGSFNLGDFGLGASIIHVDSGDLEQRDRPSTLPNGSFEARQYAAGLSLAYELPFYGIRAGVTSRYLSDKIYVYSADGWSIDAGLFMVSVPKHKQSTVN